MKELKFRALNADEIECKVKRITSDGVMLLLYKDARVDQKLLDETVGPMNWQRHHSRDNANCIISIWDEDKKQWIEKEDTGTESNTEAEKGLASDSFKRAGFNWGIGRELYTAPFIWVNKENCKIQNISKDKNVCYDKFSVKDIAIKDGKITMLTIFNATMKKVVFEYGVEKKKPAPKKPEKEEKQEDTAAKARAEMLKLINDNNIDVQRLFSMWKITRTPNELNEQECNIVMENIKKILEKKGKTA